MGRKSLYDYNSSGGRVFEFLQLVVPAGPRRRRDGVGAGEFPKNDAPDGRDDPSRVGVQRRALAEKEGYDVSHASVVDLHEQANLLGNHAAICPSATTKNWSLAMFNNVEAARDQGRNLAFFGANAVYWQIRFETSPVTGQANRTQVCYKDTSDPVNGPTETLQFRDLDMPESELVGVYYATDPVDGDIVVQNTSHWFFRRNRPSRRGSSRRTSGI